MTNTYVPNCRCKEIGTFWNISISIKDSSLDWFWKWKWYVNLILQKRKNRWKYGETHNLVINEWNPNEKENISTPPEYKQTQIEEEIRIEDIQF